MLVLISGSVFAQKAEDQKFTIVKLDSTKTVDEKAVKQGYLNYRCPDLIYMEADSTVALMYINMNCKVLIPQKVFLSSESAKGIIAVYRIKMDLLLRRISSHKATWPDDMQGASPNKTW